MKKWTGEEIIAVHIVPNSQEVTAIRQGNSINY